MSVRYIDGFDDYATADALLGNWNSSGGSSHTISAGNGRSGASLRYTSFSSSLYLLKTFNNQATWIIGLAYKTSGFPSAGAGIISLLDGSTIQCSLNISLTGLLGVYRNGTTLLTDGQSVQALSTGVWYYIEFKITIANSISAGSCKVRVNGVDWITVATGQDTQQSANAYASSIMLHGVGGSGGYTIDFDDLYILDGVAGDVAGDNDFLGDIRVESLLPSGAGTTSNFTASAGSNYQCVDEATPNNDTDYVSSSTVNHIDTYAMGNLSLSPTKIWAVQVGIVAKKADAGSRSIAPVIRNADGDKVGTTVSIYDTYYMHSQIYEQNPLNTPADWSESTVNGIEVGQKLIA